MASGFQKNRKLDDEEDEEVEVRPKKTTYLEVKTVSAKRR